MKRNLFTPTPESAGEIFDEILVADGLRIERIVSTGQSTPPGEWCDQDSDEWVVLLTGRARLLFEEGTRTVDLVPGDHVHIPARSRHRVEWTEPEERSVWLAVHFAPSRLPRLTEGPVGRRMRRSPGRW